jgi:Homeodomain-like domain-containing protein
MWAYPPIRVEVAFEPKRADAVIQKLGDRKVNHMAMIPQLAHWLHMSQPFMPKSTFVAIAQEKRAQMLAALRRTRYAHLLALHILMLCAAGRSPTDIAAVLFCWRSSVYRTVRIYREGTLGLDHDAQGRLAPPVRITVLVPTLRRSLGALLKAAPRAYGWCRTRWSCATLTGTLQAK